MCYCYCGGDVQAKGRIVENGSLGDGKALSVHVASSVCSGLVAGLVSTPADVVKTRMMNQVIPTRLAFVLMRLLRREATRSLLPRPTLSLDHK